MDNTNEELERIEQELLKEDSSELEKIIQEVLEGSGPVFEDPDKTTISDEPVVYCNYSNDYGKDLQKKAEEEAAAAKKKKKDETTISVLMSIAVGLSVGIIGMLVYWLVMLQSL